MRSLGLFALPALLVLGGCGDDGSLACTGSGDPDSLSGSYCEGSEIHYDTIQLGFLAAPPSVRIRYGVAAGDRVTPRFQIQLLGDQVQLEAGVAIPLATASFVQRWPEDGRDPQNLTSGLQDSSQLVFETLELSAGGSARGRFDILLDTGRTLRGEFEGQLLDLMPAN